MNSRAWWIAVLAIALAWGCGPAAETTSEEAEAPGGPGGPSSADPTALAVADSVVSACGGWGSANKARYVAFDFVVVKEGKELRRTSHKLDRHTGDCRLSGTSAAGFEFDVLMDAYTRDGEVMMDGEPANTDSKKDLLEFAYGAFINDAYWLFMPFKLHDPGVHLTDEGARTDDEGKTWRVIKLHFDPGTGLTPGDRYWVYVDPETYRVGRWDYHLQNMEEDEPPNVATWENWQQVGPVWLSLDKNMQNSGVSIRFENVEVLEKVPEGAFG
jgi:hypothetical protein